MKKVCIKIVVFLALSLLGLSNVSATVSKDLISIQEKMILLDSINKYREEVGLKKLKYSVDGEKLANIRVETIYNNIKNMDSSKFVNSYKTQLHAGLYEDYLDFNTKLELYGNYKMPIVLENVIFIPKKINDMIVKCFHGWKGSEGHWEAMMSESVDHISLASGSGEIGVVVSLILFDKFDKKKKK